MMYGLTRCYVLVMSELRRPERRSQFVFVTASLHQVACSALYDNGIGLPERADSHRLATQHSAVAPQAHHAAWNGRVSARCRMLLL
jgi:hypothetical protein